MENAANPLAIGVQKPLRRLWRNDVQQTALGDIAPFEVTRSIQSLMTISTPCSSKAAAMLEPMNPAPPVITYTPRLRLRAGRTRR